ncbi:transposase [Streptomyces sp. SID10853]|uniref:IS701 family transposase n=1 Tax=Streptomyces sp. SID10853 TaxID=2706028 RepID=UPI0013BF71EE|nr:transposase [Streptomyces sp. SID10853]NDZ81017.1 transposase [Streptomyces sp. SID10853]
MTGRSSAIQFTDQLFGHLSRAEQRQWAHAYVRGLLSTRGRKSIPRLATAASDSPTASQALHQFINESPWAWAPVCDQLQQWAEGRVQPNAWNIGSVVLPKRGDKSCGVHRRFIPRIGRTVNCQIGAAVLMSTDAGELPLRWSLLLPEPWDQGPRRERARVPQTVTTPAETHLLELIDMLVKCSRHEPVPVVIALDGYLDARRLIDGMNQRRLDFVLAIPDTFPLVPCASVGRAARGPVRTAARILGERPAEARIPAGRSGAVDVPNSLVQMPGAPAAEQPPQTFRLFAPSSVRQAGAGELWLTNMVHEPVEVLLRYTDRRTAFGETITLLERGFGLRDFEGRSFPGWHHHMTLVSAAFTYSRLALAD